MEPGEQAAQVDEYGPVDVLFALSDIVVNRPELPERIDIKQVGGPQYVVKVYYAGEDVWESYGYSVGS